MTKQALLLRKTHTYVGPYSDLDEWEDTDMSIEEIGWRFLTDDTIHEDDITEPRLTEHHVLVTVNEKNAIFDAYLNDETVDPIGSYDEWFNRRIKQALSDTYTRSGCAHEYDCCGCRSFSARDIKRVTGDLWSVVVYSSRNY